MWFGKYIYIYMLSNRYPNPGWWSEIRIDRYGLEEVYAFKYVCESGVLDGNKNRNIWFDKCVCFQIGIGIRAGGLK